jgi:hypothetical protein
MKPDDAPRVRLRINRLSLDLHGIAPATAEDVARTLGPALGAALGAALAPHRAHIASTDRIDAGRITSPAAPGAPDLTATIARRIADAAQRGKS